MIKLRFLLESQDSFIDTYYRVKEEMEAEWSSGQKYQSWRLIPKRLLYLTWMTFAKYGRVNERALDKIWDILHENIIKISINSNIRDGHDLDIFNAENYDEVSEEEWIRFFNFISDQGEQAKFRRGGDLNVDKGYARYSDSSAALMRMADKVESATTPEDRLIAIDQILNFIHGIGPMAKWFVEGGTQSLIDLQDMDPKGIHLKGKLSEYSSKSNML